MRTGAGVRWDVSQQYSERGKLMKELNHVTVSELYYGQGRESIRSTEVTQELR